jgi:hypothetical protein
VRIVVTVFCSYKVGHVINRRTYLHFNLGKVFTHIRSFVERCVGYPVNRYEFVWCMDQRNLEYVKIDVIRSSWMIRGDGYGIGLLVCVYCKLWLIITLSQHTSPPRLPRVLPVRTQIVGKAVKAYTCTLQCSCSGQMLLLARCLTVEYQ